MKPTNGKIIVRVDQSQKDTIEIGGITMSTANKYETNYRYKSPSLAVVVEGNRFVKSGDVLLIHHNLCYKTSAHHLVEDLFSIPFSKVLFAKLTDTGEVEPICGNTICKEIPIKTLLTLPDDEIKMNDSVYEVVNPGWTDYKAGDVILTRPSSGYTIVYNYNGIEKKVVKVSEDMICGLIRKK